MANKLFTLFDDKMRAPGELVAGQTQNLDSIATSTVSSDAMLRKIQQFEVVSPKVDFSDFSNFVFFNSALDYFNITGEKLLNEYPYDGTSGDLEQFLNSLDDYQRYVASVWPVSSQGHLKFNPQNGFAYVLVDDIGKDSGVTKTSLLSPSTGSYSVEFWAVNPPSLTGSDVMVVYQKVTGSGDGISVFFSGTSVFASVVSGSTSDLVSSPSIPGALSYYCFSYDKAASMLYSFSGSYTAFPSLVMSLTASVTGEILAGTSRAFIGSGSFSSKTVRPLTGSLDDVRIWKSPRTLSDLSSSFNAKIFAQEDLFAHWRFNESGSSTVSPENRIVKDYSGHKFHGVIQNYYDSLRSSGSLLPYDDDELILSLNSPEVAAYITDQQTSGSLYDKYNDNIINKLMPEQFFLLEEFKNTTVLLNFLYVLGRHFDKIKVSIDQFVKVASVNYGSFNQTPDALLQDVASFLGWEFTGNFLSADVVQYLLGKNVLSNTQANKSLDVKLYEIKNEFWKRTLINLMHLYKTKGTRESVESLLKIYGVNKSFVRLKEYGLKPNSGISTFRITADKSVKVLSFGSGSLSARVSSAPFTTKARSIETRVRFPTQTSSNLTGSLVTGSIWALTDSSGFMLQQLLFTKVLPTDTTGSIVFSGSEGALVLSGAPIFNNRWYNVVVNHDYLSSSLVIDVRSLDRDSVSYHMTSSLFTPLLSASRSAVYTVGSTGSIGSQMWAQECRVWNEPLSDVEMDDHTLNFQSFGTETANGISDLKMHWRLDEGLSASAGGAITSVYDYSGNGVIGTGSGFKANISSYKKFLNDFNYIASPEYGWNEEKIRIIDSSRVLQDDAFVDDPLIGLEFNLTDALNEDISQIIATMDSFNEFIGAPVNRYRDSYPDLEILRNNYFKRLSGHVNFRVFADLLEFFDRSFIDMIRRLIPARAVFLGDEFVIESHMLERPKMQWNYRRKELDFEPEGTIKVFIR